AVRGHEARGWVGERLSAAEADDGRLIEEVDAARALYLDVLQQPVTPQGHVEDGVPVAPSVDLPRGIALPERLVGGPVAPHRLLHPVEESRVLPLLGVQEGAVPLIDVLEVVVWRGPGGLVQPGGAGQRLREGGEPGLSRAALLPLLTRAPGIHLEPVGVALHRRALSLVADTRPRALVGFLLEGDLVPLPHGGDVEHRPLAAALLSR